MNFLSGRLSRGVALFSVLAMIGGGCLPDGGPDLIFHGGKVLTVNERDEVVEALAIRGGKISAVGTAKQVLALATAGTDVHNLHGRTLIPGFVAAHEHPAISAVFGGGTDISGFRHPTSEEVWETLRRAVATTPHGDWIFATGLDPVLVDDLEMPTRASLDALSRDHPVVVIAQSLHSFWANSRAFAEAGITRDTPDPGQGSYYERDADGELTGFVVEPTAAAPLVAGLKSPWRVLGRYEAVLRELVANGFTSVGSLGYNVPLLLARVAASRHLRPRIRQFLYLAPDELDGLPASPDSGNDFLRVVGIKTWYDGSPYTGSMYLTDPYLDSPLARALGIAPESRGSPRLPPGELDGLLDHYARKGWPVAVHSQGDQSSREVTGAFAASYRRPAGPPDRIEHGVLLEAATLPQLARLGVSPSFHINHLYFYGDALETALLGSVRAASMLPVRSAFELGMNPTLHADSPMFPAEPLHLMQTAILRRSSSGRVLGADEAIDIRQALRAMTINGARQLGVASSLGSLEVGKQADCVILSENPYAVDPARLRSLQVLEVYLAGRQQIPGD